jgi:hypothetical protein
MSGWTRSARMLRDLQSAFADAVVYGNAGAIAPFVVPNGLDPARRIAIYANNVRENGLATLEDAFPVLVRLAGHDWFRQTATVYLRRHPSRSGNLHYLGAHLPEYLEAELAETPYAYFADVARLEWAYQEVLVAAESSALDLNALAAVPLARQTDLVLEPSPASRLVGSVWPLLAIWRANQPGEDSHETISLDAGASRLLVIRGDDHVELRELPEGEFALLEAVAHGVRLVDAAATALVADPTFELVAALPRLVRLGAITGFHLRPSSPSSRSISA